MPKSIYLTGFHSIESLLNNSPERVLKVYIQNNRKDKRIDKLTKLLLTHNIEFSFMEKKKLNQIAKDEAHQGIVSEAILPPILNEKSFFNAINLDSQKPLILILDSIQDPRNMGACLRSANAAGVNHVIINKDSSSPINALVHKASAGAINSLQIFHVTNLSRTIKEMQKKGVWVIGIDGNAKTSIYSINLTEATAIVAGSEGKGIRQLIKKTCDQIVSIPMSGNIESLNVSVATAITLFECKRQRESC